MLWEKLKKGALGVKFRRQHPIGSHIADFYCHSLKLVIELDGKYHNSPNQIKLDVDREITLKEYELEIIRFSDESIVDDIDSGVEEIKNIILRDGSPLGD